MVPGTSLRHYRIIGPLGKGGMGEVFVAEDTRLKRRVAIKVLPPALAEDTDRRKRLEREAQAIASLNHPNIVTVHSVEDADGALFLTMEAIEGETLRDVLTRGPLPVDRLLSISIAISDALAAAHQRGITHRDLKPANVMITPEGRVKVLDFGLAKMSVVESPAHSNESTTLANDDLTAVGRIAGTVAYMSPEQAEGRPIDQRSDIFSLGVMLHELATGERPFKGESEVAIISAILKETPSSLTDIDPKLPAGLARIVRRCLSKVPDRRYQTAIDVRNDLEELRQELAEMLSHQPSNRRRRARAPLWISGSLAVVLLSALGIALKWRTVPDEFQIGQVRQLTTTGLARMAAISPDGRYVVHVNDEKGQAALWVRQTAAASDVQIAPPSAVTYDGVTFSPDGNFIYFVSYARGGSLGTLYRMPTLGGPPTLIIEDVDSAPAFSPDGTRLAFLRGDMSTGVISLMTAGVSGDAVTTLAVPGEKQGFVPETPSWSADGRTILVCGEEREFMTVMAVDAATGKVTEHARWGLVHHVQWLPDSRSYIVVGIGFSEGGSTNTQLWQVSYPSGQRRRLTHDLADYRGVSVSADGRQIVTTQSKTQSAVWVAMPSGNQAAALSTGRMDSPGEYGLTWLDNTHVVFTADIAGALHLVSASIDGSSARQLTHGNLLAQTPYFSPTERMVFFTGLTSKGLGILKMGIDGANPRVLAENNAFAPIVSPTGDWVYYSSRKGGVDVVMKMRPDGKERTVVFEQGFLTIGISPAGTQLLGERWNEREKRSECAVLPVTGVGVQFLGIHSPLARTGSCRWHPSGEAITYFGFRQGRLAVYSKPLKGGEERLLVSFPDDGQTATFHSAWSPDGRLAAARGVFLSDVVLISAR